MTFDSRAADAKREGGPERAEACRTFLQRRRRRLQSVKKVCLSVYQRHVASVGFPS